MQITVIVPTYKPQDYIWRCLCSLKNQSIAHSNYEVVIVLNGCNEPYYSEIKKFIIDEPNWRLVQTDTGGVSNARNVGID